MVYVVKTGSLVPAGPDGVAVGWPAAVDGSAAVIGVTRVPIAGPRPSTCPWPLAGLAKPVMAQLIFSGSQCPSGMPELDRGGNAKPGDDLLASQRSKGGSPQAWDELWQASAPHGSRAKPGDALWRPALNRGLHQARRCPSNGPALNKGVALSPVMPLWCASTGHRGHAKQCNAPLAYQRLTGGSSQSWRCPSCVPAILRGATLSLAMPQWRASA